MNCMSILNVMGNTRLLLDRPSKLFKTIMNALKVSELLSFFVSLSANTQSKL